MVYIWNVKWQEVIKMGFRYIIREFRIEILADRSLCICVVMQLKQFRMLSIKSSDFITYNVLMSISVLGSQYTWPNRHGHRLFVHNFPNISHFSCVGTSVLP